MRRIACFNNFPTPSSCSDDELRLFWDETMERYEKYVSNCEFERTEVAALEKRLDDLDMLLEDINYEWSRRPWLIY